MAVREYIGARYVPKFIDGTFDPNIPYEALTVVDDGLGNSYISKIPVPIGTTLSDRTYWFPYGSTSGAIINLQNQIDNINDDIDDINDDIDSISKAVDKITPVKIGGILDAGNHGYAQGTCMINDNIEIQWFEDITSGQGTIRRVNLTDGSYVEHVTNEFSHGNSAATNGSDIAFTGYSQITHMGALVLLMTNINDLDTVTQKDLSAILPNDFGNIISMISYDKENSQWIICDNESFDNGRHVVWIDDAMTQVVKEITINAPALNLIYYQDMCYDGKCLYFLMIDPSNIVVVDVDSAKVIKVCDLNTLYDTGMLITEVEGIDYYNGKFYISTDSYLRTYSTVVHSFGYFLLEGNSTPYLQLYQYQLFVDGVGGFRNKGRSAGDAYASLLEALLTYNGLNRMIRILTDLNEPLYIQNENFIVIDASGGYKVAGVFISRSNVIIQSLRSSYVMSYDGHKGAYIFERSKVLLTNCNTKDVTIGVGEYKFCALVGSHITTNDMVLKENYELLNTAYVRTTGGTNVLVYVSANSNSFTIDMPDPYGSIVRVHGLLVVDDVLIPFSFVRSSTVCSCGGGYSVSKTANSTSLSFTAPSPIANAQVVAAIPMY